MTAKKKRTPQVQSDSWVVIAADPVMDAQTHGSDPTFVRLRNPSTDAGSLYMLSSGDVQLYEVKAFEEEFHSWFVGQTVQRDGRLLFITQMDPLYLILPYLIKSGIEGKFQPVNQVVMDEEFPACSRLLSCTRSLGSLHHVAEEKEVGDLKFHRYSEEKTLSWLKKKVERTVAALKKRNISVGEGVKSTTYIRVKTESDHNEEDYLRYAHGLISEYISEDLSNALHKHLELPEITSPKETEPPSKKRKLSDKPVEAGEDYTKFNSADFVRKSAKKMTAAQKSLAKVDKTGMKPMSSFFSPKEGETKYWTSPPKRSEINPWKIPFVIPHVRGGGGGAGLFLRDVAASASLLVKSPTVWVYFRLSSTSASRYSRQFLLSMLCEGRLWSMLYGELGEVDPLPSRDPLQRTCSRVPEQTGGADSRDASPLSYSSPLLSLNQYSPPPDLQIAPLIEIQAQARSDGAPPFLLPSFCQSICQDYSDLQIGGEQVLPLQVSDGQLPPTLDSFLQSSHVLPAVEDSPPLHTSHGGLLNPLRGGSNRWRLGSTRERSFLFHNRDGPHSNSLLNRYLEQKLMDLYQQYMMENIAREEEPQAGPMCPLLGSEMVLTSIDQITLQLSREGNLEAGLAKDMVLSCLLRVAGDKQSSEISTPFLQISSESSKEKLTENEDE